MAAGLSRAGGEEQLTDELIGQVVSVVRPARPDGHGAGWAELEARREQITGWVKADVPVVKIGILLGRQGVVVAVQAVQGRRPGAAVSVRAMGLGTGPTPGRTGTGAKLKGAACEAAPQRTGVA